MIFRLLCGYAFFIPLEKILEVFFGIDTVFKPYRICALLIIFLFGFKMWYNPMGNAELRRDIWLYLIFVYGAFITFFRMVTTPFHFGYLFNDVFQMGIYLSVFVVMRHLNLSIKQMLTVMKSLLAGIVLNTFQVFNEFSIQQQYDRTGGMMDNPNYLALSLVFAMVFLFIHRPLLRGIWQKLGWLLLFIWLIYIFILAGSRTGLAVLSVCLVLTMLTLPLRDRLKLFVAGGSIILIMLVGGFGIIQSTGPLALVKRVMNKKTSDDNRIPLWRGVIKAANTTNYVGLGVGQFKARFYEFYVEENNDLIRRITQRNYFLSPHSDYLALLAIYGIVGLVCYLIFIVVTGKALITRFYESVKPDYKRYYLVAMLTFFSILLFGITSESFISALFWMMMSISSKIELA